MVWNPFALSNELKEIREGRNAFCKAVVRLHLKIENLSFVTYKISYFKTSVVIPCFLLSNKSSLPRTSFQQLHWTELTIASRQQTPLALKTQYYILTKPCDMKSKHFAEVHYLKSTAAARGTGIEPYAATGINVFDSYNEFEGTPLSFSSFSTARPCYYLRTKIETFFFLIQ